MSGSGGGAAAAGGVAVIGAVGLFAVLLRACEHAGPLLERSPEILGAARGLGHGLSDEAGVSAAGRLLEGSVALAARYPHAGVAGVLVDEEAGRATEILIGATSRNVFTNDEKTAHEVCAQKLDRLRSAHRDLLNLLAIANLPPQAQAAFGFQPTAAAREQLATALQQLEDCLKDADFDQEPLHLPGFPTPHDRIAAVLVREKIAEPAVALVEEQGHAAAIAKVRARNAFFDQATAPLRKEAFTVNFSAPEAAWRREGSEEPLHLRLTLPIHAPHNWETKLKAMLARTPDEVVVLNLLPDDLHQTTAWQGYGADALQNYVNAGKRVGIWAGAGSPRVIHVTSGAVYGSEISNHLIALLRDLDPPPKQIVVIGEARDTRSLMLPGCNDAFTPAHLAKVASILNDPPVLGLFCGSAKYLAELPLPSLGVDGPIFATEALTLLKGAIAPQNAPPTPTVGQLAGELLLLVGENRQLAVVGAGVSITLGVGAWQEHRSNPVP